MPLIKPRRRGKQFVRFLTRLDRENHETLHAYAQFLGEPADYVVNQLIETRLEKDKEFVAWRATHTDSYVPAPPPAPRARERSGPTPVRPTSAPLTGDVESGRGTR